MSDPAQVLVLLGIRRENDGTYLVVDATGAQHRAGDPVGLGKIVARLADDPEIPRVASEPTERNPVIDVAGRLARKFAPEQSKVLDMVEPLAHFVTNKIAEQASRPRRNPTGGRRKRAQSRSNRM